MEEMPARARAASLVEAVAEARRARGRTAARRDAATPKTTRERRTPNEWRISRERMRGWRRDTRRR